MYGFARKRRKGYNQDWGRIWVDFRRLTRDEKNSRIAALTSGCPAFQKHAKHAEGSDTSYVSHTRKALSTECENRNFGRSKKRSRSPAGPRRLRNSDAHERIAVPQALCVLRDSPRPRPKSGKVRRSDTRPGDVCERAERSEGSDSGPIRMAPVSACVPLCAIFLGKPSVYPLSLVKANVGRLCECDLKPLRRGLSHAVWDVASADWAVIGGFYF